jgi:hypothetical protein
VSKWQTLQCCVDVSAAFPVFSTDDRSGAKRATLEAAVVAALGPQLDRFAAARIGFESARGLLPAQEAALPDADSVDAIVFMSPRAAVGQSGASGVSVAAPAATIEVAGEVTGLAVLPPKSTTGQGERALKADLVRSLQARCISVCRGWDEDAGGSADGGDAAQGSGGTFVARKTLSWLPVRATIPLIGPVLLSDYVAQDEDCVTFAETVDRMQEVFGAFQRFVVVVVCVSPSPFATWCPEETHATPMPPRPRFVGRPGSGTWCDQGTGSRSCRQRRRFWHVADVGGQKGSACERWRRHYKGGLCPRWWKWDGCCRSGGASCRHLARRDLV